MLRFVENPRDRISGFRVVQLVPGVGPGAAQGVLDYMISAADPLEVLHVQVKSGAYRASLSRRSYIPKEDGSKRPLAVAALTSNLG